MRRFTLIVSFVGAAALVTVSASVAPATQQRQFAASQLGPDPFFGAPDSLRKLVDYTPAAVVAEIVAPGELKFEEMVVPHSTKRSLQGYATYRVIVRDVLFNRVQRDAPPLSVGSEVVFWQNVGRERAEAFLARKVPVVAGDECLLFLWLRCD